MLMITLPALVFGGQADSLLMENLPALEEVEPLKVQALEVLRAVFADPSRDEGDRLSATFVLDSIQDTSIVPLLIDVMQQDSFASVRREAARILGNLQAYEALPALRHAAENEFLASFRWVAGVSYLRMRSTDVEFLQSLLSDSDVVAEAGLWIPNEAHIEIFPAALKSYLEDALISAVQDASTFNPVERSSALKGLAQLETTRAIPVILDILTDEQDDAFVRGSAAFALGQLQVIEALPALLDALQNGDASLQIGALSALGSLKDPRALPFIAEILQDSDSLELRVNAARALPDFGISAIAPLATALNTDPSNFVREEAIAGLAAIGGEEASAAVIDFVNSGYFSECDPLACSNLALRTLSSLAELRQGKLAVSLLALSMQQLRDALPLLFAFVEEELIRVATRIGEVAPEVFDLLIPDESPYVQSLGLAALANIEGQNARETLLGFITPETNVLVRRAALEGLAPWAVSEDVLLFAEWTEDRDRRSRQAAFDALVKGLDKRSLLPIRDALSAERFSNRLQAARAAFAFAARLEDLYEALEQITPESKAK